MILTWLDAYNELPHLPDPARSLLRRILDDLQPETAQVGEAIGDGWYLSKIEVSGHVGVGEVPVSLELSPAAGLTAIMAANGTGKTSITDGVRIALSGVGLVGSAALAPDNLHCTERHIRVGLVANSRSVTLRRDDGPARWVEAGQERPVPEEWQAAYQRFQPVLLYPEVAETIGDAKKLHDVLKSALDLSVLQAIQAKLDEIRGECRAAEQQVSFTKRCLDEFLNDPFHADLAIKVAAVGATPDIAARQSIRTEMSRWQSKLTSIPEPPPTIPDPRISIAEFVNRAEVLQRARDNVVAGTHQLRQALSSLVNPANDALHAARADDRCPVCAAPGRSWLERAREQLHELDLHLEGQQTAYSGVTEAVEALRDAIPRWPDATSASLCQHRALGGAASALATAWHELEADLKQLDIDQLDVDQAQSVASHVVLLRRDCDALVGRIDELRESTGDEHAQVREAVNAWLRSVGDNADSLADRTPAAQLDAWLTAEIKQTREELFDPLAEGAVTTWQKLNPGSDLVIENLVMGGGTRQAGKVIPRMKAGGTSVPEKTHGLRVLSVGQRNALALAIYLPRATQQASPFRFMILDDPVQAFDQSRVSYLARRLVELANDYQILLFTHDERLWHEIHAAAPGAARRIHLDRAVAQPSLVEVVEVRSPGLLLLEDLTETLDIHERQGGKGATEPAITALTLAVCRQALDVEIVEQIHAVGRRAGKAGDEITGQLERAQETRKKLELLNSYRVAASLREIHLASYASVIGALNQASHAQAPPEATTAARRAWLQQTQQLVVVVADLTGPGQ